MRLVVGVLFVSGFILIGVGVWQFSVASNFLSQAKLSDSYAALTIGFAFVFTGITCLLTSLTEYRAEKRHEELLGRLPVQP
jgi:hypothetical protein